MAINDCGRYRRDVNAAPVIFFLLLQIFAGASAGSDRRGEGPATFPSFRSVMTTTSEITDASGTETKLRVAKTQVGSAETEFSYVTTVIFTAASSPSTLTGCRLHDDSVAWYWHPRVEDISSDVHSPTS